MLSIFNIFRRKTVLQEWVARLSLIQQSNLISVTRGTDIKNGECGKSKNITRMLRYIIVVDAGKKNTYMSDTVISRSQIIKHLSRSIPTNIHWVEHIASAAYVIGNEHYDPYIREYWLGLAGVIRFKLRKHIEDEKARVKKEKYIKSIIDKYTDIYTKRSI